MRVAITSAFRNAERHIERYFDQIAGFAALLARRGYAPYLLLGEGDSQDFTREALDDHMARYKFAGQVADTTHGGPVFGPVVDAQRFRQLAGVYNTLWELIPDDSDVVIFVEGDLIWQPETMIRLFDRLGHYHAVAPMVFHAPGCTLYGDLDERYFYDTWGFVANGAHFTNRPPYHPDLGDQPMRLDSAGSCIVMRAEAARRVHFPEENMVQGMTQMLAANGTPVWLQPDLEVFHPNLATWTVAREQAAHVT